MARLKIPVPPDLKFTTRIPVRITDLNYGRHVGNDALLSLIHEVRVQFLSQHGYTEMDLEGVGLIMSDVAIEFKNELFYGDTVIAAAGAGDFQRVSFDIFYRLEKESDGKRILVALAKTGLVCFDYNLRKVVPVPEKVKEKLDLN